MRIGVIGVGWGSLVLAPAFRVAQGYEVAALCSRQEQRVQGMPQKLVTGQDAQDVAGYVASVAGVAAAKSSATSQVRRII